MNLGDVAKSFHNTEWDVFDPATGRWELKKFTGKLGTTDRFQTIYNAPLHLRSGVFSADTATPPNRVVRVHGTNSVYVWGQPRVDVENCGPYVQLVNLRLASGAAGGKFTLTRKTAVGASPNKGYMVQSTVVTTYGDLQFFSLRRDEALALFERSDYIVVLPASVQAKPWDFLTHVETGNVYRVQGAYPDSGFTVCRCIREFDRRVNVEYRAGRAAFVPGSGVTPALSSTTYQVTGFFAERREADQARNGTWYARFCMQAEAVGFTPAKEHVLVHDGVKHEVNEVHFDAAQQQWELLCLT